MTHQKQNSVDEDMEKVKFLNIVSMKAKGAATVASSMVGLGKVKCRITLQLSNSKFNFEMNSI